jgi:hypothetical protein
MNRAEYYGRKIVKTFALLLLGAALGYAWCINQVPPDRDLPDRPSFKSEVERQEFYRLLRKHGLQHEVVLIHEDRLGKYFIRGNKRCAFK